MKEIDKINLEYQYTMLAQHVAHFLNDLPNLDMLGDGVFYVVEDDVAPMRNRLAAIRDHLGEHYSSKNLAENREEEIVSKEE